MTRPVVLLDTGPLLASLVEQLPDHAWVAERWKELPAPLLTCEAVLTEAAFLLQRERRDTDALFGLIEREVVRVAIQVEDQQADLRALMRRYRDRPMSLADACLVRMSELFPNCKVFTLNENFRIYRRHGNKVIPVLMPAE